MKKKRKDKVTRRFPELIAAFGSRVRQALVALDVRQMELARELGGYRPDAISFLVNAKSSQIAIDLIVRLADFMNARGVSLAWLFSGLGEMMLADELADFGPKIAVEDVLSYAMLVAIGKKMGIDLQAIASAWTVEMRWPGRGNFALPIYSLADKIEQAIPAAFDKTTKHEPRRAGGAASSAPARRGPGARAASTGAGYRTIPAEDVPTDPDWWRSYVPVIGRIAAGQGLDTAEAGQYPPAWAGEFVEFKDGPPTAVAVRVAGESMAPMYGQDDMLIVDTARQAADGQVCCVLVSVAGFREARVKRLSRRGSHFLLESVNPSCAPDVVAADKVEAAYPIIAHLRRTNHPEI